MFGLSPSAVSRLGGVSPQATKGALWVRTPNTAGVESVAVLLVVDEEVTDGGRSVRGLGVSPGPGPGH